MTNVLASVGFSSATKLMSFWPMPSRAPQRLRDATQSSAVTGWPSCHSRPSRKLKVHVSLSALTLHLSTISGCTWSFSSRANSVS